MTRIFPALAALIISAAPALAERVSVLVFDASGSMWNRVEGDLSRIEVARDVMGDYFASRDGTVPLSVIAYGHNRRGDCRDIEVIAPMGQTAPGTLETRLRGLMPRGMTPLTDSLALARDQIPPTAEAADIILVTDGLETCEGDPCALAASLAAEGIDIRAHVVGFGLSAAEVAALSCITDQTGGMLFQTNSGAELADALQQVSAVVPPPPPVEETGTPAAFAQNFVFRDIGTGTPRGLMQWRAESQDGTVLALGTTEGIQQSLVGLSVEIPLGDWMIVAEGAEGRAERQMTLTQCCGHHGIPFTGTEMAAVIPPLGQVQAGMGARLPYEITHPGVGNLGGTPYQVVATGPEASLTSNQILRQDLITQRGPGIRGASTGELAPGTYRFLIAIARDGGYDIRAERSFEVVANPAIRVMAPQQAMPGERVEVRFDGGYATRHHVTVVDENGRDVGQGNSLNRGPGGGGGGPVTMNIVMPNREGLFDIVVRPSSNPGDRGTLLARQPINIGASPAPEQGQDALPSVTATFRLPPEVSQSDVTWQALPLDPDMTSDPWTPTDTGPAITGNFEPGTWRITATAPGEVTLSADVAIFPGQPNDFTVKIDAGGDEDHGALDLQGSWRILTVPSYDAPARSPIDPLKIMDLVLEINAAADGYQGRFTPAPAAFGTVLFEREIDSVVEEDSALILTMTLPMIDPAPFVLSVMPFEEGYAGTLDSGANSTPVVFWPDAVALPPSAQLQVVLHGPNPADQRSLQNGVDAVFTCALAVCAWTDPASGLTIPLPIGWSVTSPEFATASATPTATDLPSLSLFGPEGQELRLNPRQWVDSNGTCLETNGLGRLCHFADADITAQMVAGMVAPMMFGGTEFEVVPAAVTPEVIAAPEGAVSVTLLVDWDLVAGSGGFFPIDIKAPLGFDGLLSIEGQDGMQVFTTDLAALTDAQDQALPIPDRPGVYLISILDQAGVLRATTGFEVTGGDDAPTTPTAAQQIEITPIGATQFGTGCFISAQLTGPAGSDYRMTIPVSASAKRQELSGMIEPDKPLAFEIYSFGSTGQSIANLMLLSACADIALDYGPPECRFAEGDGTALRDCPAPVLINAMRFSEDDATLTGPARATTIISAAPQNTSDSVVITQPPPPPSVPGSRLSQVIVTEGTAPPGAVGLRAFLPLSSEEVEAAMAELAKGNE